MTRWILALLLTLGLAGCQPDPISLSAGPAGPLRGWVDKPIDGRKVKVNDRGLLLSGWAAGGSGVARIDLLINGQPAGSAFYGQPRWDVIKFFPGLGDPDVGFRAYLPTNKPGRKDVLVRVTDRTGRTKDLFIHYFVEPAG